MASRPFSQTLWSKIEEIYAAILAHPFIAGLTDGTLERDAFRFYVVEDADYLREYARGLSVAAARAPSEPDIAMFAQHAADSWPRVPEPSEGADYRVAVCSPMGQRSRWKPMFQNIHSFDPVISREDLPRETARSPTLRSPVPD